MSTNSKWLALTFLVTIIACGPLSAADEPDPNKAEDALREQGLKNMQRSAAQYTLSSAEVPPRAFEFHEKPAMRFSNPISLTADGALFVWSDRGRPQALL